MECRNWILFSGKAYSSTVRKIKTKPLKKRFMKLVETNSNTAFSPNPAITGIRKARPRTQLMI
jgi:hypothetical protein